ncbi:MAG: winged helix-turn-helix transcriptional regulator [Phenylobacterium sp.]|uniref:winged helix-turn-helix domain-containing protein n=1 Tax=Phenylobacterium sp. TaxID=1871053 RepID=UPI00273491D4|nr:winged helix-turn-helix transcriptional regulator [Phenylobacterium sp.]MDP3174367.1 winged helix-turn-helix transcriptional regulator [Phenylobacterium sp.]
MENKQTTQKTAQKILEAIKANPRITRKELSAIIGITEDGIKFNLSKLKKEGALKRVGSDKGGYWEAE